jgi:hypothetical protein
MNRVFYLLIPLLFVVNGCKIIDELTQFEMEYNESIVIPSSTGINIPLDVFTPDIESNAESTFAVNNTNKDLIEEIILTQLDLTLTSPSNGDFSFLNSIEIYISAEGLEDVKIAWKYDIASDVGNYIDLETTNQDIKEFIKKEEFVLKTTTVTDELLSSDHQINIHSIFYVDAKILGQ